MNQAIQQILTQKLLAMADDELILAHRNSEWIGHAPILEEDIALANIAQDELGHANIWYELHQPLTDDEPDELAFFRDAPDFRNVQLVELPCGDWAFTMLRQYLFDAYELLLLDQLQHSRYQPLAEACAKIRNEEIYHLRHTSSWIKRLGLGTAESHQRTQAALDELWPYAQQLFVPLPGESILIDEKIVPNLARLHESWLERVRPFLTAAQLTIPHNQIPPTKNRSDHTTHLSTLLTDMQKVARLNREAVW
ncbi:MAG: phenylacetate-CoA oxygenase subunit PaaC [Ardenticatenaceae bacterium]|nr:phenylacetate-CoA oxygenase subunit PaaC [Anaerolineales bacterium]MCB8937658.1 phenylacetate-CoA oxygenase subunit PaaC [Ardenticatenaceae bacterium]MCB8974227.1 phenylacetate-CoA oxygenase subunit PaaC [Ardenticatenaceae bacterium]